MNRGLRHLAIAGLLLLATLRCGPGAGAADGTFKEYEVKAVFLLNFAQFVEWPASAFSTTNAPLVIGVIGDDPFGVALEQMAGERVQGHPLLINRGRRLEDVRPCHILFISKSENPRLSRLLRDLRGTGVLTVGESEPFNRACGIITFITADNRVRFEINTDAADREEIKVSAKLLKVAKVLTKCEPEGH